VSRGAHLVRSVKQFLLEQEDGLLVSMPIVPVPMLRPHFPLEFNDDGIYILVGFEGQDYFSGYSFTVAEDGTARAAVGSTVR
jgi:hypothetical protein